MKAVSNDYKNAIKTIGREIDAYIVYEADGETIELGGEMLNSITPHYEGGLLQSVMKQLDIDSNVDIPIGATIECKFGVKVANNEVEDYRDNYEYISFGDYIVYSSEKQEDLNSYKIVCYDLMLNAMKDYETPKINGQLITYPITIRNYLNTICVHLGVPFASVEEDFTNFNREIPGELFLDANGKSLNYTFRDVLDQIAEITASTICINDDNELEVRYINNTNETLDEEYLKDINVNFGEQYGPINTITFKRSADADQLSISYPENLPDDQKNEIAISNNQFLYNNNRGDYLEPILNRLKGLTYYLNDYVSTGIAYFDLCDRYNVQITNEETGITTTYSCIMFNDEVEITQGLVENIHTDRPKESKTNYNTTSKDDRTTNRTTLIVDKVNGQISSVVSKVEEMEIKVDGGSEYNLTADTTFQENKEYFIKDDNEYIEYPQYKEYLGDRTGNPNELGLYEPIFEPTYIETDDTTFESGKTYYEYDSTTDTYSEYTGSTSGSPVELDLFELTQEIVDYELTEDTTFTTDKDYYEKQYDIGDTIPSNTYYEEKIYNGIENDYTEITNALRNKADVSSVQSIETSVKTLQTNTYSKTQVQEIANGSGYFKSEDTEFGATTIYYTKSGDDYVVYTGSRTGSPSELDLYEFGQVSAVISTEATFNKDGMRYTKTNGKTESLINLNGLEVDNLTRNTTTGAIESREIGLYAGYVPSDATFVGDLYKGQTIVYTKNLISRGYTEVGVHGRFEEYAGPNNENGVGFFII